MRIAYLFDQRLPSSATDTEQVLNTTTALARAGARVTLLLPRATVGEDASLAELLDYYQVTGDIELVRLRSLYPSRRVIEKPAHALRAALSHVPREHDLVYTRNLAAVVASNLFGHRYLYETYRPWPHQHPPLTPLLRHLLSHPRCIGGVFHSDYCRGFYEAAGIPASRLAVVHNGYDPSRYDPPMDRDAARDALDLPRDRTIFTYSGRVNLAKGLGLVLDLAQRHPEALFLIIGSEGEGEVETRAAGIENVRIVPWLTYDELPPWLFASDVLVIPPSTGPLKKVGNTVLPMKLFLYLAAGRAILAPASPDTAELLTHDVNAHLVPADELDAASAAVSALVQDPERTRRLGEAAREQARGLTWDARARRLLEFIEQRL